MRRAARGFAGMQAVCEDLPVAGNRVTLTEARDRHGVPPARVRHDLHPESAALWQDSLADGRRVFEAAGAREIWTGPRGAMHIMGGTPMGRSPDDSVTDGYGRVHGVPNLVIAGPGLFPTCGGVNPTFTVHALAARAVDPLLRHGRAPD